MSLLLFLSALFWLHFGSTVVVLGVFPHFPRTTREGG
jgi:hypothetical protein